MTPEELGVALREARQARDLSLEQVADRLKISLRVLRALEEWDQDSLPHTVYVRGFARDYGTFLGLDEEDMAPALAVLGALGEDEVDTPMPMVYTPPASRSVGGRGRIWLALALAVCLAGGGFAWMYRDAEMFSDIQLTRFLPARPAPAVKSVQPAATDKKQEAKQAKATAPPQNRTPQPAQPAQNAQNAQPAQATPPASATQAAQSASALPQAAASPQVNMPQPAPPTTLLAQGAPGRAAASDQHKLVITALAECWIHSSADDADIRQFSLRKGDTFALTFHQKLTLKLGNAGGVRIRYDGTDMPPPGREGQVRTLTFPPTE